MAINRGPLRRAPVDAQPLTPRQVDQARAAGAPVIDVRTALQFDEAHIPGAVSSTILHSGFGTRLAWIAAPDDEIVLVGRDDADALHAAELAAAVGLASIAGYLAGGMTSWREERPPRPSASIVPEPHARVGRAADPRRARARRVGGRPHPGALLTPYHDIRSLPDGLDPARPVAVICASGRRAAVGAGLVQRHGAKRVPHVVDGGVPDGSATAGRWCASVTAWPFPASASAPAARNGSLRHAAGCPRTRSSSTTARTRRCCARPGETRLRVLEPSHAAMNSSLHSLAGSFEDVDLGAFLYALRRLPASIWKATVIVMGQEAEQFTRVGIGRIEDWEAVEAPARRRRWYDSGEGILAVLLASTSDLDDVIPTLVAYQLEWNKLNALLRARRAARRPRSGRGGRAPGRRRGRLGAGARGVAGRAHRVHRRGPRTAGWTFASACSAARRSAIARLTRRWWAPVRATLTDHGLLDRPMYFVSSNPHSLVNLVTGGAGASEDEIVGFVEANGPDYIIEELERFRSGRTNGSWENFLYYGARLYYGRSPRTARRGTAAASTSASSA